MKSEDTWLDLEKDNAVVVKNQIHKYLLTPSSSVDIYIGLIYPEKHRTLIFRTESDYVYKPENFPDLKYFNIVIARLPEDPPEYGAIKIILLDDDYKGIFSVLADDIINSVKTAKNKRQAIEFFYSRLSRWINFLESFGIRGLSMESARGLFGELWFLYTYLIKKENATSVESWTGPKGTPQDFQFPGTAVEVKTTIMKQPQKIRVSNELQLDDKGIENLFLFHLSVIERKDFGETLPSIIRQIRGSFEENIQNKSYFDQMLFDSGYLDEHAEHYASTGYTIRQESFFRITDGFPRLIESDLPEGIGDLNYSVNVSSCSNFTVSGEFVIKTIKKTGKSNEN
jgi:hypothetical protein